MVLPTVLGKYEQLHSQQQEGIQSRRQLVLPTKFCFTGWLQYSLPFRTFPSRRNKYLVETGCVADFSALGKALQQPFTRPDHFGSQAL